ncbi:MAG: TdeIII family type II restriction endonuclease [Ignavibacteria bacterium]|nr:TdeIII family type II restriction endonuclease [Ignavibacteria bacterium]
MSAFSVKASQQITVQIDLVVNRYLQKAVSLNRKSAPNPFVFALLKDFEPLIHNIHGLKTSLGTEMEKIAEIIANESWGKQNVSRKSNLVVSLPQNVFQKIDTILNGLSNVKYHPNYLKEKSEIIDACVNASNNFETHKYEIDLQLYNPIENHHYYLEMKGPDPNTTEVPGAKKRLLALLAFGHINFKTTKVDSILGIYYNNMYPKPYKNPKVLNYFDPAGDMMVHDDFWNFIGKNSSTFSELLQLFHDYGEKNKRKIWDGFSKLINLSNGTNPTTNPAS